MGDNLKVDHGKLLMCELIALIYSSRADRPPSLIRELSLAAAVEGLSCETGPPPGTCLSIFSLTSAKAFSATGFLLGFLNLPISRLIR